MQNKKTETLPVVPLRGLVVLPGELLHFDAGRDKTIEALQAAVENGSLIFMTSQRDPHKNEIEFNDIYDRGTICKIRQLLRLPGDSYRVLVEGISRGRIYGFAAETPYYQAEVVDFEETPYERMLAEALMRRLRERFSEYSSLSGRISSDVLSDAEEIADANELADFVAQHAIQKLSDKQSVLECEDTLKRLELVLEYVSHEVDIRKIDRNIAQRIHKQMNKNQREYYLREQVKAIRTELGDTQADDSDEYRERMAKKNLPADVQEKLKKEIDRLAMLPSGSHEAPMARAYIECVLDLPWTESSTDNLDVVNAVKILDEDHFGMEKVKKRIVEHLAVAKLTNSVNGQIICFVGPPGVGKTSITKSIAKAMGREFVRMSLGGIRDEAEIRGHRRTYIGAMPGRVITAMRQAGKVNPLILFDEIDKMGSDYRGDPASAMLEVLDSAQNHEFRDHFLEIPYDLSNVMFITTANSEEGIPRPLLDRMEVIYVDSYLENEKVQIALRHLLPKQMKKNGLSKSKFVIPESLLAEIIRSYTSESGVRELERVLASLCRKAAVEIAEGKAKVRLTRQKLYEYLGQPKYRVDPADEEPAIGMVNGLAWTCAGGDTLTVEATSVKGTGQLSLTGHLGDVMQESARAAMTYVRAHAGDYGLDPDFYSKCDVHVHVPEGAVPKDGPSAGITIATAIVSAVTGIPVKAKLAMTGEITLRGRVLPIGGLREKLLAAVRAGIRTVIIPKKNRTDLSDVPDCAKDHLKIIFAEDFSDVLKNALCGLPKKMQSGGRGEWQGIDGSYLDKLTGTVLS
ncbi:MAG: Lon protease 1 [Firmicutes bacterium ADurb.Bin182]|nr:MAG: Lon protease 1 [Firmicutes bacterium ADurb.Bin182]